MQKFLAAELEKYSDLHDELMAKDTEVAKLKTELEVANSTGKLSRGSLMPSLAPSPQKKKTSNKRVTIGAASYKDADEFFKETFSDEESEEEEDDEDSDDEWRQTPMFKRLKQERAAVKESRQSLAASKPDGAKKRRKDTLSSGSEDNDSDNSDKGSPKKKLSLAICKCKTGCKTKKCACKKAGPWCSEACKCDASKCAHREVPGPDVSTNSNNATNKENMSVSEGDNTANLLNGTFDVPTTRKPGVDSPDIFISSPSKLNFDSPDLFATTPKATRSPVRESRSPLKPMFKKPIQGSPKRSASGSETDTTSTNRK